MPYPLRQCFAATRRTYARERRSRAHQLVLGTACLSQPSRLAHSSSSPHLRLGRRWYEHCVQIAYGGLEVRLHQRPGPDTGPSPVIKKPPGIQLMVAEAHHYLRFSVLRLLPCKVKSLLDIVKNGELIIPHIGWSLVPTWWI